jgi:hypothetical protein
MNAGARHFDYSFNLTTRLNLLSKQASLQATSPALAND